MSNNNMYWGDMMAEEEIIVKPVENKWTKPINLTSVIDTEDFPESKILKIEVIPTPRIIVEENKEEIPVKKEVIFKSALCKSIKDGKECPYGLKCKYVHYLDELAPNKCNFGDKCLRVKYNAKNIVRNVDNKNVCCYIHPEETMSMYIKRHGLSEENMKRPQPEELYKYTRMCNSILNNITCERGEECTYAHSFEQLKISTCMFGNNCRNILQNGSCYSNNDSSKCYYIHPEEIMENFKKRITDSRKRVATENIDETKIKKQKISVPIVKSVSASLNIDTNIITNTTIITDTNIITDTDTNITIEVNKENVTDIVQKMISCGITNFKLKIV